MSALQKTASIAKAVLKIRPAACNNAVRFSSKQERDAIHAKFQAPGDTPVFLRGGPWDKALFGFSCVLVGIGVLHTFWRVYCRM